MATVGNWYEDCKYKSLTTDSYIVTSPGCSGRPRKRSFILSGPKKDYFPSAAFIPALGLTPASYLISTVEAHFRGYSGRGVKQLTRLYLVLTLRERITVPQPHTFSWHGT
jgi:hypothetical protein